MFKRRVQILKSQDFIQDFTISVDISEFHSAEVYGISCMLHHMAVRAPNLLQHMIFNVYIVTIME